MQLVSFLPLFGSSYSFLFVESGAFLIKLYILGFMGSQRQRIPYACWYTAWLLFMTIVGCSAFVNLSSVIKMLSVTYLPTLDYRFVLLVLRLAWAMWVLQRLFTILFLKYMTDKDYRLTLPDKVLIVGSSLIALYFIVLAFTDFSILDVQQACTSILTDSLEFKMMRYCTYFCDLLTIIYALRIMNSASFAALPKLLRWQARTFVLYFIVPYAISTTVATFQMFFNLNIFIGQAAGQGSYTTKVVSTLLITAALWYCVHRLIRERFFGIGLRVAQQPSERERWRP